MLEPPPEELLDVIHSDDEVQETLVVDAETGGLSHIKVGSSNMIYNFEAALSASRAIKAKEDAHHQAMAAALQNVLSVHEVGACVDLDTPADGHCLFSCISERRALQ